MTHRGQDDQPNILDNLATSLSLKTPTPSPKGMINLQHLVSEGFTRCYSPTRSMFFR